MKTLATLLAFLLIATTYTVLAEQNRPDCGRGHCEIRCPRCKCCVPSVEVEKIKEHCWEVECEPVCIPHVTFPWQKKHAKGPCGELYCPPAKCAKVRNVHVLKLVEYECEHCKYTWKPVCAPPCGCASPGCADGLPPALPPDVSHLPAPPPTTTSRQSSKFWKFGL